jgi:hypothetical protein
MVYCASPPYWQLAPDRQNLLIGQDLNQGRQGGPHCPALKIALRDLGEKRSDFVSRVPPAHTLGDHPSPQAHQSTNGWIHRQEVAVENLGCYPPQVNLGTPAVIGLQDDVQHLRQEIRLHQPPGFDAHLLEVSLADASLALYSMHRGLCKPLLCIPLAQLGMAFPSDLCVLHRIPKICRAQRPAVLFGGQFPAWHLKELSERGQRVRPACQGGANRLHIDKEATPHRHPRMLAQSARRSLLRRRRKANDRCSPG